MRAVAFMQYSGSRLMSYLPCKHELRDIPSTRKPVYSKYSFRFWTLCDNEQVILLSDMILTGTHCMPMLVGIPYSLDQMSLSISRCSQIVAVPPDVLSK